LPRLSLKLRLTPLWPVIAAGAVAITLLAWLLPRLLASSIAEQLLDTARLIEPEVADRTAGDPDALQGWVAELAAGGDLRLTLIEGDGTVIADSDVAAGRVPQMDDHAGRPEVAAALAQGTGWSVRTSATTHRSYVYAARATETAGGGTLVVRLAQPATRLAELRGRLLGVLALALLAALAVTAAISWWLDRELFRPLDGLIAGAGELAAGRYGHRLPRQPEEGLARLADAMNRLAARVEEQIAAVGADRDHLRAILESMSEGVLVVDAEGRARFVNAAFRRLFGLTGDFEGRMPREVTRQPELAAALQSALAGRPAEPLQIEVLGPERRSVALAADALRTEAGGAIVTVRDTTELNRVSVMRRDFVANVSHELKTPLSAIRGYAETLRDGALDEADTARRFTERILEQCRRLQALLDDLLTLSRLESAEAPFETRRVDLAASAARAAEAVSRAAEERGVTVTVEPPEGKVEILGDLGGLERLLVNLLDNAVKYNRAGGRVTVRLAREGAGALIEVADTGIGIPEELQPRIFERFYRVDKGRARDEGGTGLGLAIVKHVAQRHGGSVEVESRPGEGSAFRVRLLGSGGAAARLRSGRL
jgi:two-component system phosphate regulon sensor histidine kinase PhoR